MAESLIDRLIHRTALRQWSRLAATAPAADPDSLRGVRLRARRLRREVDLVLLEAEHRLALPMIGSAIIRRPLGTDWAWRPDVWRGPLSVPGHAAAGPRTELAAGATVFHDCVTSELTLRQVRSLHGTDIAPFALRMDVFRFDGSFLSLAVDLPPAAVAGLKQRHLIRMDAVIETEKPLEIFVRLNVKHGPNVEQIVRELPLAARDVMVEFDLNYIRMNERRVEKLWIDVIFEGPQMNQILIRDLTLSRRPRADL